MSKFTVNGVELEFEFMDADEVDRYLAANEEVVKKVNEPDYTKMSKADGMRHQCKVINEFFDSLFGAGTANKLFKGKNNIMEHMEAFSVVAEAARSSDTPMKELSMKYAPNRAQRRAEAHQGSHGGTPYYAHPKKKGGNGGARG